MSNVSDLYHLEMEEANKIFGEDNFLSIHQLAKRTGVSHEKMNNLFAGQLIPAVGISKARYALALSSPKSPREGKYILPKKR